MAVQRETLGKSEDTRKERQRGKIEQVSTKLLRQSRELTAMAERVRTMASPERSELGRGTKDPVSIGTSTYLRF